MGPGAVLGQGHQSRLREYQRQGRGNREQAGRFARHFNSAVALCRWKIFYEWKETANGKQPYAIALVDQGIMALAGLWEKWRSPTGEWVRAFAIVTTTPNECAELRNSDASSPWV